MITIVAFKADKFSTRVKNKHLSASKIMNRNGNEIPKRVRNDKGGCSE